MPRIYDFGAKPTKEQYVKYGMFIPLDESRLGSGEMPAEERFKDIWSDDMPHAQLEYKRCDTIAYYDNAALDPVFDWLNEHAVGSWHWHEDCVNNYRSLVVDVWFENPSDMEAFQERWSDRFKIREWAMEANARAEAEKVSSPASPSP